MWSSIRSLSSFSWLSQITHWACHINEIALIILSFVTALHLNKLLVIQRFWQVCHTYFLWWKNNIYQLFPVKIARTFPIFNWAWRALLQLALAVCVINDRNALIFLFSLITSENHMILTKVILNSHYVFIKIWRNICWNNLSLFWFNFLSSFSAEWSIFMVVYWNNFIKTLISLILKLNYSFLVINSKLQIKVIYVFSILNESLFPHIIIFWNYSIYSFNMF